MRSSSKMREMSVVLLVVFAFGPAIATTACEGKKPAEEATETTESTPEPETEEAPATTAAIDHAGITSVPTDPDLIAKGEQLFKAKGCTACHKFDGKLVGPSLRDVTTRREPEWLARMILHPDEMLEADPTARKLLEKHLTPMPNQNVTPDEARALIAFLGTQTSK